MKSNLLKDFFSYGTVGVISKFVGFFTIPIYTRFLSKADFGILEILSVIMVLLAFLSTFQLESSFLRLFFDKKETKQKRNLFSSGLWIIIPGSIILSLALIAFNKPLANLILQSTDHSILLIIAISELMFKNVLEYSVIVFRVEFNRKGYTTFNLIYVFCNALLGIIFVAIFKYGLLGLLISRCVVSIVFAGIALFKAKKYVSLNISFPVLKEMLTYGVPLIPVVLAQWGQKYVARILIIFLFSLSQIGIYAIATKVLLPLLLLTHSLKMAWHPYTFDNYKNKESKALFNDFYNFFAFIASVIAVVLILFGEELLVVFASEKFADSQYLIGILSIAYILYGMSDLISTGILIRKKNNALSYASITGTFCGCLTMYLLSIRFGLIGIVIGELFGELVKFFLISILVKKIFTGYFKFKRSAIALSLLVPISFILNNGFTPIDYDWIIKSLFLTLIIGALSIIYFFRNQSLCLRMKSFGGTILSTQLLKK